MKTEGKCRCRRCIYFPEEPAQEPLPGDAVGFAGRPARWSYMVGDVQFISGSPVETSDYVTLFFCPQCGDHLAPDGCAYEMVRADSVEQMSYSDVQDLYEDPADEGSDANGPKE